MADSTLTGAVPGDPIRWGIIGCGDVTEVKSGPAFQQADGSRLVAVMRRSAYVYAERHDVPRLYADADELIADPAVDALYIATPPDSHAEYTRRAAAAGKPVYVEKPMARTYGECELMVSCCRDAGVPLFVAYYRRRLPLFLKAEELLRSGAIGDVRFATVTLFGPPSAHDRDRQHLPWRVVPEIAGNGDFFDLGSHQLDLLDYLLGPISRAHGTAVNQAGRYDAADTVSASFQFESGVIGSGLWCFDAYEGSRADRTEIVGNCGKLTFSTFELATPLVLERDSGVESFSFPPPTHVQQPLIQTVTDELLGRGRCPSTGESAARTNRILELISSVSDGRG